MIATSNRPVRRKNLPAVDLNIPLRLEVQLPVALQHERRAREEFNLDPDFVNLRKSTTVEHFKQ